MVYLNTHTEDLDMVSALSRVSDQRRRAALRYLRDSDRRLSLAVYLLLQEALEKEYGITGAPRFAFGPHGKPFLPDHPHIHFNLSHCPGVALCVVGDAPVGCDVERVPERLDMDLCRHVCHESELAAILHAPSPTLAFASLWTRKEALLKYTGEGLAAPLPQLLLSPAAGAVRLETVPMPSRGCVYSICRGARDTGRG